MGQADRAVAAGSRGHGRAPWDKTMAGSADMAECRGLGRSTVQPAEVKWVGATLRQVPISKGVDAVGPRRTRQGPGRSQESGRGARHSPDAVCVAQQTDLSGCTRCHEGRCLASLPTTRQCNDNAKACQASGKGTLIVPERPRQELAAMKTRALFNGPIIGHAKILGHMHAVHHPEPLIARRLGRPQASCQATPGTLQRETTGMHQPIGCCANTTTTRVTRHGRTMAAANMIIRQKKGNYITNLMPARRQKENKDEKKQHLNGE
ncbi:hypothetical protein V6N12_050599 [Hibiscus sabdariffa]|uniref:Uncharacterized protein n=1 Tax=Hibiscus sabdariffa TaxID=183260 RepID=A0ABR2GCU8_9ROSI